MAKQLINRGTNANDGTGDNLRTGANKVNINFNEIYTAIGDGSTIDGTVKFADDSSTVSTISANGETLRVLGGTAITTSISGNDLTINADTSSLLSASGTATITNKTIDFTDNTLSGTFAELNTAISDATIVDTSSSQALTNKDLTGAGNTFPTISIKDDASTIDTVSLGQTLTFEGGSGITTTVTDNKVSFATDGSIVTETSTDTLTNKTISGADNTITNLSASNITGAFDNTSSGSKIRFNFANVAAFPNEATYEGMFAYDIGGNQAYVADAGGWTKLINENASVGDLSNVNIVGVSDGQALLWSSAQGRFNPGSVASAITIQEEGSSLSTGASTLNFVGSAVTASGTGATKTITITGGDVVSDTTPQLGGGLDAQANFVTDASYFSIRAADVGNVINTITVTVISKTTEHPAHGAGSLNGYVLDGIESPAIILTKGTYRFDQSDSSNAGHPLAFYYDVLKARAWTTDVTTNGTPGSAGAYTQINITSDTPRRLAYQCTAHPRMGHEMDVTGGKTTNLNIETDKSNTGDGSNTTITLNTNDRTVDSVLVFVNGLCLVPTDDYTISGSTLTFATAPANNAEIVIRYLG